MTTQECRFEQEQPLYQFEFCVMTKGNPSCQCVGLVSAQECMEVFTLMSLFLRLTLSILHEARRRNYALVASV